MSIRRPDLGPAGRAELDEPIRPPGLGPADRGALAGEPKWPVGPREEPQPTAGGIRQPLGTGTEPPEGGSLGEPDAADREDDRDERGSEGGFDDP